MVGAKIRMEIYAGLAVAFGRPHRALFSSNNEHSLMEILSQQTRDYLFSAYRKPSAELLQFIETNAQNNEYTFWQNLEIEYNRLFVGPYSPKAHPYESIYRSPNHQVLDEQIFSICREYGLEGFFMKHDFHDLPDHIVAELEYMALLCEREYEARHNCRAEIALQYLLKQYDFLVKHLGVWASEFSNKIESSTDSPFYRSLAAVLRDFVSGDLENLRDEIHKQEAKVLNSPASSRHEKELVHQLRGKIMGKEAGCILEVNSYDCILCGACVSGCPTEAFRITSDQQSIRLLFKSELCSGCEQCLALCPQEAIKLFPGYDHQEADTEQKWIEVAATQPTRCSGCGVVYSPDKIQQRVLASFSKEVCGDALFETLSLCSQCKRARLMKSCYEGVQQCHAPETGSIHQSK
ncbi:MAG: molecular chaperone TorD family protein [Nitrospiria bacterium]